MDNKQNNIDKILSDYEEKLKNEEIRKQKKEFRRKNSLLNFKEKIEEIIEPEMSEIAEKLNEWGHRTNIVTQYNEDDHIEDEMPYIRFYAVPKDKQSLDSFEYRVTPSISFYLDIDDNKIFVKSDYLIGSVVSNASYNLDNIKRDNVKKDMTRFIEKIFKL